MAESYISELGDSLSHGVANTNGDRVKIIAPKLYNDGNGNHPSIATALLGKVDVNNVNLNSQTTTILAQVQSLASSQIHYKRFYTQSDGGSANISDKPTGTTNAGFMLEAYCNRYVGASDWRYVVVCYVQTSRPKIAWIKSGDTSISWQDLNTNTDTLVKATAKTDNVNYKVLATASASPTSGNTTEAVYDTDISLNPSTNTITANISGNAATATSAGQLTTARTTYVTLGTASTTTTRDWSGTTTIPVSGTLQIGNGGTGKTTAIAARNALLGDMNVVDSAPEDSTPIVMRYANPADSNGAVYTRKASHLWTYIKGKMTSDSAVDISGSARRLYQAYASRNDANTESFAKLFSISSYGNTNAYSGIVIAFNTRDSGNNNIGGFIRVKFVSPAEGYVSVLCHGNTINGNPRFGVLLNSDTSQWEIWTNMGTWSMVCAQIISDHVSYQYYSESKVSTEPSGISWFNSGILALKPLSNTATGSTTRPVYVNADGTISQIDYTIATSVPSGAVFTDTKVTQTADDTSTGTGFELLFSATGDNTTRTETSRKSSKLTYQPSTGTLKSTTYSVNGNCTLQFNATTNALDFVFA